MQLLDKREKYRERKRAREREIDGVNIIYKRDSFFKSITSLLARYRVITGMRLKKINQVIHIQIQEGQLLPRGGINTSTIDWRPVDAFSVMDFNTKNSEDYHKIVWEKRALDLDDLIPPQDHLLTGNRQFDNCDARSVECERCKIVRRANNRSIEV